MTGPPGIGKTTLILRLHDHYRNRLKVAGMVTQEARHGGQRVGFRIRDLSSGEEGWLARTTVAIGPKTGKYTVDSQELETIGVKAVKDATEGDAQLVLIDEVGPMEMTSPDFRAAIERLFQTQKTVVATVKYNSHYPEIEQSSERGTSLTVTMNHTNRDKTVEQVIKQIDMWTLNTGD